MSEAIRIVAMPADGRSPFVTFADSHRMSEALGNCTSTGTGGRTPDRTPVLENGFRSWTGATEVPSAAYVGNITSGEEDWGQAGDPAAPQRYPASAVTILRALGRLPGEAFHISITPLDSKSEPTLCVPSIVPRDCVTVEAAADAVRATRKAGPAPFPPLPAAAIRETPVPSYTGLHAPGGWKQILD